MLIITVVALSLCTPLRQSTEQSSNTNAMAYEAPAPECHWRRGSSYSAPPPQPAGTNFAPQTAGVAALVRDQG
jgi:hypothetical protein